MFFQRIVGSDFNKGSWIFSMQIQSDGKRHLFWVKITPKASRTESIGWEESFFKIKIQAVPEKGLANETLISFLSLILHTPKSNIHIVRGLTSRLKRIQVEGISLHDLQQALTQKKSA
jgi:uncharacterized protein (TIGR00251 family)